MFIVNFDLSVACEIFSSFATQYLNFLRTGQQALVYCMTFACPVIQFTNAMTAGTQPNYINIKAFMLIRPMVKSENCSKKAKCKITKWMSLVTITSTTSKMQT